MIPRYTPIITFLVAALALLSLIQPAHAATAAGAGIKVDGKHIGGYAITWTKETRENLVAQLASRPITFERTYKIPVDAKDPNVASIQGNILLLSHIRGDREIMGKVKTLKLVKRDGKWYVDAASLNRALKIAQIK